MDKDHSINALQYDAHNFNKHTQFGKELLKKSVKENGFGRSIVVDKDNNIIAGNGIVEAAKSLGKKNVKFIDTTGDELVVVRRTDIGIDSEAGRRMALADNATSAANLSWDYAELEEAAKRWNVKFDDWGVKIDSKEYLDFVEKFKKEAAKTTDDCYTPQDVYECIKSYFVEKGLIPEGAAIVRPFYPGGDYENETYPDGCIVFDNPPFSILASIVRFYIDKNIKFLLFAPGLTFMTYADLCTAVVLDLGVIYANGADVNTCFLTNLYPEDYAIVSLDKELRDKVSFLKSQENDKKCQVYKTPDEVVNVKVVTDFAREGIPFVWRKSLMKKESNLDGLKSINKKVFNYICFQSRGQTRLQLDAMRLYMDKAIIVELSDREKEIIDNLSKFDV